MKISTSTKNSIINIISYLYILLFVYASVSKLLDFENFQIQLAQSPLLSAYAGIISIAVILVELIIAGLLSLKRTRLVGLYSSFSLMISFTVYIYLILNYSDFVPCSCGGILEKMGWTEHLIFNLVFVALALIAIVFINYERKDSVVKLIIINILIILFSVGIVIALFLTSEHIIKKENSFIRRFHQHPITEDKVYDLKANSYYFAGLENGQIYLGNISAPLILTTLDTAFVNNKSVKIQLDEINHQFLLIEIKIKPPYYYVYDGNVPVIYRAKTEDSIAKTISLGDVYFSELEPSDSTNFIFRSQSVKTKQNVLGKLNLIKTPKVDLEYTILNSERDGIFDTDGQLIQDIHRNEFVYVHYYKNEFLILDSNLKLVRKLHTIDTISKPQIEIKSQLSGKHQMGSPPLIINKNSIIYKGVMFNESNLMGKYESRELWEVATVIDMYKTDEQNYLGSFFIEHRGKDKMSQMMVTDKYLFVLSGNEIVRYRFAQSVTKHFKKGEAENPN